MSLFMNVLIGILIAVVAGGFASVCVVLMYHKEMRQKAEDPILPIEIAEVVDDAEQ